MRALDIQACPSPEQIRKIRGDYTQERFAAGMGVAVRTISRWENGRTKPNTLYRRVLWRLWKRQLAGKKVKLTYNQPNIRIKAFDPPEKQYDEYF